MTIMIGRTKLTSDLWVVRHYGDGEVSMTRLAVLPSACPYCVGTPKLFPSGDFAAQYPARSSPCQRFAYALADAHA